ncbi:MAG: hypothetical protein V3V01_14710 [Acidimicrobiales bacterium]
MDSWESGRSTIEYLLDGGRLEHLADGGLEQSTNGILDRATKRLSTARLGLDGGDPDGAYVSAYDAYRMAAESLLIRQALRATGGDGSHVALEDAIAAQFSEVIPQFSKPILQTVAVRSAKN